MKLLEVLPERKVESLNRPFSYIYEGNKPVDKGYRVLIPFNTQKIVGYVISSKEVDISSKQELEEKTGYNISSIIDVLDEKPLLNDELMALAERISKEYLSPLIGVLQCMLPTSLKPTSSSLKGPKIAYETYLEVNEDIEEGLTPKQIELFRKIKKYGPILKRDLNQVSIIKKLLLLNKIKEVKVEKKRLSSVEYHEEKIKSLTNDQLRAVDSILKSDKLVSLLYGVTGSGKTEVYLKLSEHVLNEGKTVLMLVPEISLTPRMVDYFKSRFKDNIAILHSGLTPAEKYDEYRHISEGDVKVVVGARSAIFAPLDNIGLIILDEEHVESYKQDSLPYYHAKDVAIFRAEYFNAKVVLGSATPSLESFARARKGVYNLVELKNRINQKELPKTSIVDLSSPKALSRESFMFSEKLIVELKGVLERKEQAILLINRRGFSGYVTCRNCGHMFACPNCGITLTYHKEDQMLKCHHCGHVEHSPKECPECGSTYLSHSGFGTERIVKEINKLFPSARVLRLDSDVGEVRQNIPKIVSKFMNQEADILVGTQMIAKGHDFPNVTLVGVILADIGLSLPSFRSTERVFELITQAVGRSGRSEKEGKAIIQTYNPYHYVIQFAARQDYLSFYKKEMEIRKLAKYPPYVYMMSLQISSKNEDTLKEVSHQIASDIISKNFEDVIVLGPVEPYISHEFDTYHRIILIKYKTNDKIYAYIKNILESSKGRSSINIKVDINPYSL